LGDLIDLIHVINVILKSHGYVLVFTACIVTMKSQLGVKGSHIPVFVVRSRRSGTQAFSIPTYYTLSH
jgi:hypothetical protein